MTNTRLKQLIDEFIETQDDSNKDDWYVTSKEAANSVMLYFLKFLESKKIRIEG